MYIHHQEKRGGNLKNKLTNLKKKNCEISFCRESQTTTTNTN